MHRLVTRAALADPGTSPQSPALVWKRLAPLVAASGRSLMRLWNPDTEKFSDTAKRTDRLPSRPAAVYLYTRKRTQLLWLDFDSKRWGPKAVDADMATAAAWLSECGGIVVTDHSTSGGAHLLCPLAIGTTASHDEMVQLVRLLSARLPTLDITPNTNAETGCMTPPGSPCREGGYRTLDCSLDAAVEAFTTRSAPDLLPRLYMLLGALNPSPRRNAQDIALVTSSRCWVPQSTIAIGYSFCNLAQAWCRSTPVISLLPLSEPSTSSPECESLPR